MILKVCGVIGTLVWLGAATSASAQTFDSSGEIKWEETSSRRAHRKQRWRPEDDRYSYSGLGARPRQWCGWWMRKQRGGGPEYNLAWNWRKWGSSSGPQVGAIVVWRHHVGEITGRTAGGQWIVRSGNDGGAVRERARSLSGAIFRI